MEPTQANTRKRLAGIGLLLAGIGCFVLLGYWAYGGLQQAPLSQFVRSDLPMLDLDVQWKTIGAESNGSAPPEPAENVEEQPAAETSSETAEEPQEASGETAEAEPRDASTAPPCPELVGGDTREASSLSDLQERSKDCPKTARWVVKRHPIGFSLAFQDASKLLALFESDSKARPLFETKFVRGLFYEPLHSASVRAEDLQLEGLQGAFLSRFVRESLSAHGVLHYDVVHGKKGFVFSFVRNECPFASKALPLMVRSLARSGYRTPTLEEPILEMRIGLQRLFLTQAADRVYCANGLEALLNVLESLRPSERTLPPTPLVLTVRAEAFLDKLLPVLTGAPTLDMDIGFGLSEQAPGALQLPKGTFAAHLRPKLFKGVLAGIPHDAFGAVAASFYLPPDFSAEDWRRLATEGPGEAPAAGPDEAGVALVWDLSSDGSRVSQIGVVLANQTTPDDADRFKRYFKKEDLTDTCGGGTVFLAATSRSLLVRMRESCERQSLSVLDWERGARAEAYVSAQLFLFLNPGSGMRELFLAGGARPGDLGEFEPKWKQELEAAKQAMREEGETVFGSLPIFGYAGSAEPDQSVIALKGFTVRQGASR